MKPEGRNRARARSMAIRHGYTAARGTRAGRIIKRLITYNAGGRAIKRGTDHSLFFTLSPTLYPGTAKGDTMSRFKDIHDKWRNNERAEVLKAFDCHLKDYVERTLGRGGIHTLALLLGVHDSTANQWVHGEAMPPSDKQCFIAKVLGIPRGNIWEYKADTHPACAEIIKLEKRLNKMKQLYREQLRESN